MQNPPDPSGLWGEVASHDDVFGTLVVAVDGVVGDQPEVDVPRADPHARVVSELVARLARVTVAQAPRSTSRSSSTPWAARS